MDIKAFLHCFYSKRDFAGNCYFAFSYIDANTDQTISATVSGGESNVRGIMFYLNGENWEPRNVLFYLHEMKIREFNRKVKDWPHAGSQPEELAKYITERLKP